MLHLRYPLLVALTALVANGAGVAQEKLPSNSVAAPAPAQKPASVYSPLPIVSPTPVAPQIPEAQEAIKTLIEEVQLSVAALDSQGRLDPSLELDDILVLENGVPQQIRSARRVPAQVLLVLDTGGELNSAKRVGVTREIARELVTALSSHDQIAVMQFNNKVELLQDWTNNTQAVHQVLDTKLLSGKRARFLDALMTAANVFKGRLGNRHLVMITDGVQSSGERVDRDKVIQQLLATNAVVHVISYTTVSLETTKTQRRVTRKRDKSIVPDDAVNSLPSEHDWDPLRQLHKPGGIIADMDPERRQQIKEYEKAMRVSERDLSSLAQETGGHIWLPESFEEMIEDGAETARLIDSQYLITYKPKRPLAFSRAGEIRRIDVASRRVGLNLVSRRHYVVPGSAAAANLGRPRRVR